MLTTWQVDVLTVVDLNGDELTLDELTWYHISHLESSFFCPTPGIFYLLSTAHISHMQLEYSTNHY